MSVRQCRVLVNVFRPVLLDRKETVFSLFYRVVIVTAGDVNILLPLGSMMDLLGGTYEFQFIAQIIGDGELTMWLWIIST
jgi:hypothetical protein